MGSIYQPKLKSGGRSSIYWLKYYANGKCIRESSETDNERKAKQVLKEREGRAVTGQPILPRANKITYQEIRDDLRRFYSATGGRALVEVDKRLTHLDAFFRAYRVVAMDRSALLRYIEARQAANASNGTINREVSLLGTMLRHAVQSNKLLRLPDLRKLRLKEAEPRSGFFEEDQFQQVRKHLPDDLQTAVTVAYTYGWRMQSEVLSLERRHLDLEAGTLSLEPSMTKNGRGRIVYLTPELKTLLGVQSERVRALERKQKKVIPWLFPHLPEPFTAPKLVGTQRRDFRKAWVTACAKAGLAVTTTGEDGTKVVKPLFMRHDFRRTAARNLIRRGVPERVAMTVTGHLTRSVFDRYNIVSVGDLQEAARRLSDVPPAGDLATGHVYGHVRRNGVG